AIIRLTEDKIPLIFFHSIAAAIACESESAINHIINRLAKAGWAAQLLYVEQFKTGTHVVRQFIEKRLIAESHETARVICYKILSQLPPSGMKFDIKDLYAANFELRLAALRYAIHTDKEKAIPYLIEKLTDPHWEIRLKAVHRLGAMKLESVIWQIADCLEDEDWWVKMSAAEALKSLGRRGIAILKERQPELADIPFDASRHESHTLW
ncbi:MAG: HEAT repeat domain-containing protein, partial [Gammaproteobacteria bacterium]|nr:HEAT repeat domain-containing protein [Gammaproteobacteria bacterium]